jgi:L-ascorbate metabolism protein UlaG (beta-lactamase superfamily)
MEVQFYGANCIKIVNRKVSVVIDDNLKALGAKPVATAKDIVLSTTSNIELPKDAHFGINSPGEYEVSDVSISGIPAPSHLDDPSEKKNSATMYRIIIDGVRFAVVGHVHPNLTDTQLEALGTIDILCIPVGGNGFTLDGVGAQKIIKEIEPRIVIPTHFEDASLSFEVPQAPLDEAVKSLGMEIAETVDSLKLKNFEFGEGTRLFILNKQ